MLAFIAFLLAEDETFKMFFVVLVQQSCRVSESKIKTAVWYGQRGLIFEVTSPASCKKKRSDLKPIPDFPTLN